MVDQAVQSVVLDWADAPSFESANHILNNAREKFSPDLLEQLRSEVAEINVESFLELLLREKPSDSDERVEIQGVSLSPQQLERVSAWLNDQKELAAALGLSKETWSKRVDTKMQGLLQRYGEVKPDALPDLAKAKQLLGVVDTEFEARPEQGKGFASLLAARGFKKT